MGRERGPVHERGPGGGDDVAPQARRPASDRDGARRGIPDSWLIALWRVRWRLPGPSFRRRLAVTFTVVGAVDFVVGFAIVNTILNLWLRPPDYAGCSGQIPVLPPPTFRCPYYPTALYVVSV